MKIMKYFTGLYFLLFDEVWFYVGIFYEVQSFYKKYKIFYN